MAWGAFLRVEGIIPMARQDVPNSPPSDLPHVMLKKKCLAKYMLRRYLGTTDDGVGQPNHSFSRLGLQASHAGVFWGPHTCTPHVQHDRGSRKDSADLSFIYRIVLLASECEPGMRQSWELWRFRVFSPIRGSVGEQLSAAGAC